jgi:hypothetical protein
VDDLLIDHGAASTDDRDCSRDRAPKSDSPLDTLYSELGGPAAVGRMLGISTEYAAAMKRRGSIPLEHWPVMIMSPIGKTLGVTEARLLFAHTSVRIDVAASPENDPAGEDDEDAKVRWTSEDPSLIVSCQPATRVYQNPFGQVVICQEAREYGEDDPFVFFQPENVPKLIAALQTVARES